MTPAQRQLLALLGRHEPLEAGGVAWPEVIACAGPALYPMLAWRVQQLGLAPPPGTLAQLFGARTASATLLVRRRAALRRALEALDAARLPVTVLKGAALARLYPAPELRVMGDVDLWIRAESLRPAIAALEKLGWQMPWWRRTRAADMEDGDMAALRLGDSPLMIELHLRPRSLAQTIGSGTDAMWEQRVSVDLGGLQGFVLRDDDQLLHLCLHLAEHHRFVAALPRLLDITVVLGAAGDALDWAAFVARVRALGVAGWVATSLGTARLLLAAPVPDHVLSAFEIPDLEALCGLATEQTWLSEKAGVNPYSLGSASGWRRIRVLRDRLDELLFPPEGSAAPAERAGRLVRRLRYAAQVTLPAFLRARRTARLDDGAGRRNQALVAGMRRWSTTGRQA